MGRADAVRVRLPGRFTTGGLTGLFVATLGVDVHVHDTYFVVAHFHYIMVGGTTLAYWFPKMFGKMYPEGWAKFAAPVTFVGFNLTFFPQFILGYMGMPAATIRTSRSSRSGTGSRRPARPSWARATSSR